MSDESVSSDWLEALLTRITAAEAQAGHELTLLRDSHEHEPAVLALIAAAKRHICLENYQIGRDAWADTLFAALCQRATEGVRVQVLYDWLGSWPGPAPVWLDALTRAGGECLAFNPWHWREPLSVLQRDHRKLVSADGHTAIISGWCQSARWRGKPGQDAWRDTGLRLTGPAVGMAEQAFAETWGLAGGKPLASHVHPASPAHGARVRLLTGRPRNSPLFRLDQQLVSLAQSRIWLTDAYPVGTPAYLDGLRRAAADGTDVRLLVPGSSDLPLIGFLARSSYRALLEAGVRVFEWNGAMLHAKTAIFDERWCRIGSTNLNPASWLGNHELDVLVDDCAFASQMAQQFEEDLKQATEIVLHPNQRVQLARRRPEGHRRLLRHQQGSASAVRLTRAVSQAVREARPLAASDASLLTLLGITGLLVAAIGFWRPAWLAWPFSLALIALSISLLRVARRRRKHHDNGRSA